MTRICVDCPPDNLRYAVEYQSRCRVCLQRKHERLTPLERRALAAVLNEAAAAAPEFLPRGFDLALDLTAIADRLTSSTGRRFLGAKGRALAADVLRAAAYGHENQHGTYSPALEHLYRKVTHEDRRTGLPPPWSLLV